MQKMQWSRITIPNPAPLTPSADENKTLLVYHPLVEMVMPWSRITIPNPAPPHPQSADENKTLLVYHSPVKW